MTDDKLDNTSDNNTPNNDTPPDNTKGEPDIEKIVKERIAEALKPMKENLDKAYGSRDDALKRIAEFEKKEKDAELKRLQEEGKHKEAYELQLAEEKARREVLEKRNIELTRDIEVRNALGSQPFRNDNALEMAYKEIVGQLVQNEQGLWVHKSGVSVKDYVKSFAESEDNSFLFKVKASNGGGTPNIKSSPTNKDESIFNLSQAEVLKRIAEGKISAKPK